MKGKVGKTNMMIALSTKVDGIDGVEELLFERLPNVGISTPLAKKFSMNTDQLGDLGSVGCSRNDGLST